MSQRPAATTVTDHDHDVQFHEDVLDGLQGFPKSLSSMYLYDQRGSRLFDAICELPEYYPTRTELGIMRANIDSIVRRLEPQCLLIEYGSGSSLKTRYLLEQLISPSGYVPIDISRAHLVEAAESLSGRFPQLEILPVCADFNQDFELPEPKQAVSHNVIFFPGSTIGNLRPVDAEAFLLRMSRVTGTEGGLLIGVDLKKDLDILLPAYDDSQGVTAEFNLNLLRRINRELNADFDLGTFRHDARYNEGEGRIEMHLVSQRDQEVTIGDTRIEFERGESIHTENSYKYELQEFEDLANAANWTVKQVWTDDENLFSVQYLETCDD